LANKKLLSFGFSFASDVVSVVAHKPPLATIKELVNAAFEKRVKDAKEVLIAELRKGADLSEIKTDKEASEFVQMLLRFSDAVQKGAARRNLQLLARVIRGLKNNRTLDSDKFQKWANILESLTRDEILLLASVSHRQGGRF
jgi:hypothetical protein